jgi:hypothetical protein
METMNVVLAVDRDPSTGVATHFLVGVADRVTHNWLERPSVMGAAFVAQRIRKGIRFETFHIGEAGPDLVLQRMADGSEVVISAPPGGAGFTFDDLPPCGTSTGSQIYRGGKPA